MRRVRSIRLWVTVATVAVAGCAGGGRGGAGGARVAVVPAAGAATTRPATRVTQLGPIRPGDVLRVVLPEDAPAVRCIIAADGTILALNGERLVRAKWAGRTPRQAAVEAAGLYSQVDIFGAWVVEVERLKSAGDPVVWSDRIGSGDVLEIGLVCQHLSYRPHRIRVEEDGRVRLPVAGFVRAGGLSEAQLGEALSEALAAKGCRASDATVLKVEDGRRATVARGAIRAGDLLEVDVGNLPEDWPLENPVRRVAADGTIPLPHLGPVTVAGLSAAEAGERIEQDYARARLAPAPAAWVWKLASLGELSNPPGPVRPRDWLYVMAVPVEFGPRDRDGLSFAGLLQVDDDGVLLFPFCVGHGSLTVKLDGLEEAVAADRIAGACMRLRQGRPPLVFVTKLPPDARP